MFNDNKPWLLNVRSGQGSEKAQKGRSEMKNEEFATAHGWQIWIQLIRL
jgi:hypothetical protein